ncbi:MAG: Phosphoribulokinase [Candidatus Gottesmanbacteria bacterium GW2011_GWC2_42_8]|nr:MAG: Phosphoribulokinase [Candidatus Gottesmanbacteria bacterium GW2011_GWC2_42_8]
MIKDLLKKASQPFIVGVAGDSGSGKTMFAAGIRHLLGEKLVKMMEMDGYHKESRRERAVSGKLPLNPQANHLDRLVEHLKLLKEGQAIDLPVYNHTTGEFDHPLAFSPSPIIIVEGLHALYPEFLPYLDLTVFVDPCRDIKWQWKSKRDKEIRRHEGIRLEQEMLVREAAYKRWIDFQKTEADIVIKIFPSTLKQFARYQLIEELPEHTYKVELMVRPSENDLPNLFIPLNIGSAFNIKQAPFLLSAVPSLYWGRKVINFHLDGIFSHETLNSLEKQITDQTGISTVSTSQEYLQRNNSTRFAQLLIVWRFLSELKNKLDS